MSETTTATPASRAGSRAGAGLLTGETSYARALAEMRLARNERVQNLDIEIGQLALDEGALQRTWSSRSGNLKSLGETVGELAKEYDQNPVAGSWFIGLMYIGMSFLVLLADFVFLTQIVARAMELNPTMLDTETQDSISAVEVLLTPRLWETGIIYFADIYFTTFGILLLGMSFKVFAESWARRRPHHLEQPSGPAVGFRRQAFASIGSLMRSIPAMLVLILTTMTLVALAYVRTIDPGPSEQASPELLAAFRFVAALIGLATPAVGVYLFSRGMSIVSIRVYHFRSRRSEAALVRKVETLDRQLLAIRKRKLALQRERDENTRSVTELEETKVVADEFRLGYAGAVKQMLDEKGGSGSYRRLRTQLLIPERGHR